MPRGYGRRMGRGMAAMGYAPYAPYGYRYGLTDRFRDWLYGARYGRGYGMGYGMGRGRGYGATMGYCPYTGLPRGWRWTGQYPQQYGSAYYPPQYRRDEE